MPDGTYSLADLCGLADVTPRTVRYYIAQGLLRSPGTSGPGARYDEGHLARLRLIRRLQREHLPLAEIRARLAALTDDEAIAQAEGPAEPPTDSALDYVRDLLGRRTTRPSNTLARSSAPPPAVAGRVAMRGLSARSLAIPASMDALGLELPRPGTTSPGAPIPDRSHWERYTLAPDVELHVRRPLTRSQNRAVAQLIELARRLLEEDQP